MTTPSAKISPEDRIPFRQKIAFAFGVNTDVICMTVTLNALWLPIFNIGLGMNAMVLSSIIIVFRIWDAFTDPLVGNISDNARTRWGRRRPFIFVGAILVALIYPLFWHLPAAWSDTSKSIALVCVGLVFYSAYTLWSMPYYGLQLELTPSYDERTRLAAWGSIFAKLGYLVAGWVFAFVLLMGMVATNDPRAFEGKSEFIGSVLHAVQPLAEWLAKPGAGESHAVVGMRVVCWVLCLALLVCGLSPALFVKERYYKTGARRQPKTPFIKSLKESMHCKPLWLLIGMTFFLVVGSSFMSAFYQHVNIYYVCGGDLLKGGIISGWKGTVITVTGFLSIPILTKLSERFDKRKIVLGMLTFTTIGHLSNYVLMTPEHPYLQIVSGTIEAVGIAAFWLFMPAMKADVADWDEMQTARRREGSLNSFYSWFVKAGNTVSVAFTGIAVSASGFIPKISVQSETTVNRMFAIYLILPIVFWLISIAFAWRFPITRKAALEMRAELENRRGKV